MKLIRRVALLLSLVLLINLVFVPTAWAQLPGPLEDMLREAEAALYGSAQSIMRVILAIPLWLISRLCLYVGTLGTAFPDYFGDLITQTLDHVVSSNIRDIIQQSVYVAISLTGLSLLLKPLWPEFRPARFQRIVLWGALIGFFLTQASSCYSTAENTRMTTASNIASIISGGQDSIDIALDMIGATREEVQTLGFTELPDTAAPLDAPNGSMTIHELFHRCPYDPEDMLDTDADCHLDHASDPFAPSVTLNYNLAGLVSLLLGLFPSMLVFAEGLAFLGMGISAGILFVVFPFTALLAFYTPLEGVPAAVIKGYVTILIKTIILSILSAILIDVLQHNFSIGGGPSVVAMAGIGLVEIFIMAMLAKEGLSSIFATFSTITNSVSNVGQNLGVAVGGAAQPFSGQPSTEGMAAAAMLGGGNALAMTMMGGANPYMMASMGRRYSPARAVQSAFGAGGKVALKTAEVGGKLAMKAGGAALAVATGGASAPVTAVVAPDRKSGFSLGLLNQRLLGHTFPLEQPALALRSPEGHSHGPEQGQSFFIRLRRGHDGHIQDTTRYHVVSDRVNQSDLRQYQRLNQFRAIL